MMTINHSSTIEIDRDAIANNIKFIRQFLSDKTKLSAVVKGNAYGHGIRQMVPELEHIGVDHFSVFSSFEAKIAYRYTRNGASIMIMGDIAKEDTSWVVRNDIEFFVYNLKAFEKLLKEAKKQDKTVHPHIELETGMNRHGLEEIHYDPVIKLMQKYRAHIELEGLCTHFAGAESTANFKRIQDQQKRFKKGVAHFKETGFEPERLHTSCSAGIIAYPDYDLDMVRVGILTYGLWPSKEIQLYYDANFNYERKLKSVLSWRSHILDVKNVAAGEFVGYGNSFLAESDMQIASVPVGYGYGFSRSLSNTGRILVNGKRLSVVGMVNMNMFLIEVTNVDVKVGDTVTLIGDDGGQSIHVSYFGNLSEQLNYELLTRLDKSIPRMVV
jgi:alanine racemase